MLNSKTIEICLSKQRPTVIAIEDACCEQEFGDVNSTNCSWFLFVYHFSFSLSKNKNLSKT